MTPALLLVYQEDAKNNKLIGKKITYKRDYFKELSRCIESWRTNGGKYKDIEIFIFTDAKLDFKNCRVEPFNFESKFKSKYGFINVHLAGLEAHKLFKDYRFIHIDLDMFLQQELPEYIFNTDETILGAYSKDDEKYQRTKIFGDRLIETDFIATSNDFFYKEYFKYYNFVKLKLKDQDDYDIEEYVADFLHSKYNFKLFEDYEVGEGFYGAVQNPYFIHEHIKYKS